MRQSGFKSAVTGWQGVRYCLETSFISSPAIFQKAVTFTLSRRFSSRLSASKRLKCVEYCGITTVQLAIFAGQLLTIGAFVIIKRSGMAARSGLIRSRMGCFAMYSYGSPNFQLYQLFVHGWRGFVFDENSVTVATATMSNDVAAFLLMTCKFLQGTIPTDSLSSRTKSGYSRHNMLPSTYFIWKRVRVFERFV